MFLIIANGSQICGTHADPDAAKQGLDDLTAAHPGTDFTVFQQVHPKDPDAEPQSAVVESDAKTPEVAQGQADAHHGE